MKRLKRWMVWRADEGEAHASVIEGLSVSQALEHWAESLDDASDTDALWSDAGLTVRVRALSDVRVYRVGGYVGFSVEEVEPVARTAQQRRVPA